MVVCTGYRECEFVGVLAQEVVYQRRLARTGRSGYDDDGGFFLLEEGGAGGEGSERVGWLEDGTGEHCDGRIDDCTGAERRLSVHDN